MISTLYADIFKLVEDAKALVANTANKTITLLYWKIGERINNELLNGMRAKYGKQIVSQVATQLSWSHFIELLPLKDPLQREFYLSMAVLEKWGRNTLRDKLNGILFERTALSKKPEELIKRELAKLKDTVIISPDLVFKSPYFLDFVGLKDTYFMMNEIKELI